VPRPAARALAFALALAGLGCARSETGATILRRSALGALPRESVGLLALEVRSLRSLKAFDRWAQEMTEAVDAEPRYRDLRQRLGPDALERIDRVGLAIVPLTDGRVSYGLIAEGHLDDGATRRALGGQETVTLLEAAGRPDLSVSVIPGGGLAFGPRAILEIIRRNAARRGLGLEANAVMGGLLGRVRPAAQVWGAIDYGTIARLSREAALAGRGPMPVPGGPVGSALQGVAFQGRIGASVDLDFTGVAGGAADARRLADAARGLAALGKMGAGADRSSPWIEVLDGLSVRQSGAEVAFHVRFPPAALEALAEKSRAAAAALPEGSSPAPPGPPAAAPPPAASASRTPALTPRRSAASPAGTPPSAP
jgi:hypothetical protein